jgi:hypothetical protein
MVNGGELMIWPVVYDEEKDILYVEVEQHFHVMFSPFKPAPSKYALSPLDSHFSAD